VLRALQADGLPVVVLSSRRSPTSRAGI
jgi:hypothetical protein